MPDGARIVVKCNHLGQPIGDEGGVLGKFLGTIARLGGYCPLDKKDWRNVKKDGGADTILQCVQVLLCDRRRKSVILASILLVCLCTSEHYFKYSGDLVVYAYSLFPEMQTKFLYPAKCDKWILKTTGRDWRRFKAGLKKNFFSANKKRKSLYKLCPEYVDTDQWRELVKFWKSKKGRVSSLSFNWTMRAAVK